MPVIEQITLLAQQPDASTTEQSAKKEVSRLQKELAILEEETAQALSALEAECCQEILRLEGIAETLDSPLERAALKKVKRKTSSLKSQVKKRTNELTSKLNGKRGSVTRLSTEITRVSEAMVELLPKYPRIEIKKIPWLKDNKPQIVPINIMGPSCSFNRYNILWPVSINWVMNNFLKILKNHFKPYMDTFQERFDETKYSFVGMVPTKTKEVMNRTECDFTQVGGFLLMLADSDTLKIQRRKFVIPENLDPLIVGYHPDTPNDLWLIAAFDMTPVETLIVNKALKPFHEQNAD